MDTRTKEVDPMQLQIAAITPELGVGYGRISAANRMTDHEANEAAREARNHCVVYEIGTPVGCMDGRPFITTLSGGEAKVGPKTGGGSAETALFAYEVENAFDGDGDIYDHIVRTIDILEDGGKAPVRFHVDSDHAPDVKRTILKFREELADVQDPEDFLDKIREAEIKDNGTGCGMGDQFRGAMSNMARLPRTYLDQDNQAHTETDKQMESRLESIKALTEAVEGTSFSNEKFEQHVARATELMQSGFLDNLQSIKLLIVADRILRDRGDQDGVLPRIDVLESTNQGVHGHIEDLFVIFKTDEPIAFDATSYYSATKRQAFSYNMSLRQPIAAGAGALSNNHSVTTGVMQGCTEANIAGAFQLINGTQRAVIYSL
jgi:hypothetical protein